MKHKTPFCPPLSLALVLLALAGCAAPPAPPAPMAAAPASLLSGRIAAIRPVSMATQDSARGGLNAVLDALDQPEAATPLAATEIVFLKNDGNAATFIQPGLTESLTPGAHVAIITGDSAALLPSN